MVSYEFVWITCIIWNIIILAMTTYLVFWKNASGFWFVFAFLLLRFPDNKLFFECQQKNRNQSNILSNTRPFFSFG